MDQTTFDVAQGLPLSEEALRNAVLCNPGFAEGYTPEQHRRVLDCALALAGKRDLGDAAVIMRDVLTGLNALEALARAQVERPEWSRGGSISRATKIARAFYLRAYDKQHPEAARPARRRAGPAKRREPAISAPMSVSAARRAVNGRRRGA